jgi:hypothetical protein
MRMNPQVAKKTVSLVFIGIELIQIQKQQAAGN